MRDSVAGISVAGLIGAVAISITSYITYLLGMNARTLWDISAEIFLRRSLTSTPLGIVLGFTAALALSIITAATIYLILKVAGGDFWWLKGIIAANAFTFINVAFFMPLLGIYPALRANPLGHISALLHMTILGLLQSGILARWLRTPVRR